MLERRWRRSNDAEKIVVKNLTNTLFKTLPKTILVRELSRVVLLKKEYAKNAPTTLAYIFSFTFTTFRLVTRLVGIK